jgi:hypothetical protein
VDSSVENYVDLLRKRKELSLGFEVDTISLISMNIWAYEDIASEYLVLTG